MTDVGKAKEALSNALIGLVHVSAMHSAPEFTQRGRAIFDAALEAYVQARIVESLQKHGLDCYQCAPPGS